MKRVTWEMKSLITSDVVLNWSFCVYVGFCDGCEGFWSPRICTLGELAGWGDRQGQVFFGLSL